jgi:hypothetical protein
MQIVRIYDEVKLMEGLLGSTISMMHNTTSIQPIKKLVAIHDIIDLNLTVSKTFTEHKDDPIWDKSTLKEMNILRAELFVYYYSEFKPFSSLQRYNNDIIKFFNVMALRESNKSANKD